MVTDYEAAWVALGERISGKPQHGRAELLQAMAELAAEHRVPAGELSRLLRLHGVEVERARSMATDDERFAAERIASGLGSGGVVNGAAHHRPDGGHDGYAHGSAG